VVYLTDIGADIDSEVADEAVTDANADMHGLGNKNPVMMLYEYCAKKNWKLSVMMDDKPSDDG
jgi:hypothetical protein